MVFFFFHPKFDHIFGHAIFAEHSQISTFCTQFALQQAKIKWTKGPGSVLELTVFSVQLIHCIFIRKETNIHEALIGGLKFK